MSLIGSLVSAGAGLVGGLFGGNKEAKSAKDQQEKQYKLNRQEAINRGEWIREGAEKSGFNPLTYLGVNGGSVGGYSGAGGGGGSAMAAPLASFAASLGDAAGALFENSETTEEAEQKTIKSVKQQQQRLEREQAAGGGAADVVEDLGGSDAIGMANVRPEGKPGMWSKGNFPVILPDGTPGEIPAKLAERLKLRPWDVLMAEDYEAIGGDELGQVAYLPRAAGAMQQVFGGLTGYGMDERMRRLDRWDGGMLPDLSTGVEVKPPLMSHQPEAGWMDEFFK